MQLLFRTAQAIRASLLARATAALLCPRVRSRSSALHVNVQQLLGGCYR